MRAVTILSLLASLFLAGAATAENYTLEASPHAYNKLVFPRAYSKIVIPPYAELQEKPMPLGDSTGLLLRPKAGAEDIPVFIELDNDETLTVTIKTNNSKKEGGIFRYRNAPDQSRAPQKAERPNDSFIARVMGSVMMGKEPLDMPRAPVGYGVTFTLDKTETSCNCMPRVLLEPVSSYKGSQHWVNVYRIHTNKLIEVDPRDFWREGVVAISVESDYASKESKPLVAILEVNNE